MRYPLIDGQGNFGSRDGDERGGDALHRGAPDASSPKCCSTKSTRARSTSCPTTTARARSRSSCRRACRWCCSTARPASRWAWRPKFPSHNLSEVAQRRDRADPRSRAQRRRADEAHQGPGLPGRRPDHHAARGHASDAYATGRGSVRVRARWKIEDLARGQWQVVVHELPPGTSRAEGARRNRARSPTRRPRPARSRSRRSRQREKQLMLSMLDTARDESRSDAPGAPGVRAEDVARSTRHEFINLLLAQTSLESATPRSTW